jgi:hypothetical protein
LEFARRLQIKVRFFREIALKIHRRPRCFARKISKSEMKITVAKKLYRILIGGTFAVLFSFSVFALQDENRRRVPPKRDDPPKVLAPDAKRDKPRENQPPRNDEQRREKPKKP